MMMKMWGMSDEGCGNADDSGGNNGKVGEGLDLWRWLASFPPSLCRTRPCSPPSLRAAQVLDVRFCVLVKRTEDPAAADVADRHSIGQPLAVATASS